MKRRVRIQKFIAVLTKESQNSSNHHDIIYIVLCYDGFGILYEIYEIYIYIYIYIYIPIYSFAHSQRASINKVLIYSVKNPDHLHYTVSVQYQEYHYILILKMLFGATYAFMGIINFSHLF